MLKLKKMLSLSAAAAMLAAALPAAVSAEDTAVAPETVLYENNFSGADVYEAFPSYENEYMSIAGMDKDGEGNTTNNTEGKYNIGFNAEGYIYSANSDAYKNGRTILADFTKGGAKGGITGGAVKISYDFMLRSKDIDNASATGVNMSNHYAGAVMLGVRNIDSVPNLIVKNSMGDYDVTATTNGSFTPLTTGEWYTLDIVMDLDAKSVSYYLDGARLEGASTFSFSAINNVAVCLNGLYSGFDNFKISKLNNAATYEITVDARYSDGCADVVFPTAMDLSKGAFTVDGEAAEVKWLSVSKARIFAAALNEPGTHTIALDGVCNIFGVAPTNESVTFTTAELGAEEILYENTFPNGANSVNWTEWKDYGAFEGLLKQYGDKTANIPETVTFNGNTGIRGTKGQWPTATQFCFDFTKSGTQAPVNSGIYKFSWDFSLDGSVTSCDKDFIGINMDNAYTGICMLEIDKGKFYILEGGKWDTGLQDLDPDKVYTIDTIIDFDSDTVDFYIDGVLKYTRTYFDPAMSRFNINFCQCMDYFDNLKVSKLDKGQNHKYSFKAKTENAAKGYVELVFDAAMNTSAGSFTIDGAAVPAENVKWTGLSKVRLYADSIKTKGVYTASVNGVADMYGIAPKMSSVTFETLGWEEDYVIYENTFNRGEDSLAWYEGDSCNYGFRIEESTNRSYPVVNGNPGFRTGWKIPSRTFMVDFTKTMTRGGASAGGLTTGKIKFSVDFKMQQSPEEPMTFGVNLKQFYEGNICAIFQTVTDNGELKGKIKTKKDASSYTNTADADCSNVVYVDLDKVHTMDFIIDLDVGNTIISYYLDGEKLDGTTTYWQDNVPNICFCPNTNMGYIDNIKISRLKEGSFGVEGAGVPNAGQNYIDIYTTEAAAADITADKVTVNGANPTAVSTLVVPGSYTNDSRYVVRAELAEPVTAGTTYELALSADTVNFMGTAINAEHLTAAVTALDKTALTIENGAVKAVVVNNGEAAQSLPVVVVAAYDAQGAMTSVADYSGFTVDGAKAESISAGKTAELTVDVSGLQGTVKAFMLKDLKSLTPIVPAAK